MKKFLVSVAILFVFCSNSFAFTDSLSFSWAKGAIDKWSLQGYVSGYPDGSFRGNNFITRAEVISVVNKLNNSYVQVKKRPSNDVNYSNWFYEDMAKASLNELISVDENGNLRPNDYATREEVMVIFAKLFDISYSGSLEKAKVKLYNDSDSINSENYYRVAGIVEDGYVTGYEDNTLRPKANITRAEFICMLNNAVDCVLSEGEYSDKAILGNVVINGRNVKLINSEIKGKVFILDGARNYEPTLINTMVSQGINSRVGNALIKNTDKYTTLYEYNFEHPEEVNEPVVATLKYSDTDWTNDDIDVKVSFNNDDVVVKNKKITFDKNGDAVIEYEYNGKTMYINAKVDNIDKIKPVVKADIQDNTYYATVTVTVEDDGLSPIKEISCNGITNKRDKETGIIENTFTISKDGTYTASAKDEAGNVGKVKFTIKGLKEPDITYTVAHFLQNDDGTYSETAFLTASKTGVNNDILLLSDIEKINEPGYEYAYGMIENNKVTEVTLNNDTVIKLFYEKKYVVSYDFNGGNGTAIENQIKGIGEAVTISAIIPTKENREFLGWTDNKTDLTVKYQAGDVYSEDKNLVLYAVWKGINITYTVEHYLQIADGSYSELVYKTDTFSAEYGSTILIDDISKLNEQDYVFSHSEKDNDLVTKVEIVKDLVIKMYYKYQYKIIYDSNNGSDEREIRVKYFGEDAIISDNVPTKKDYNFIGWSTDANATTYEYKAGDVFDKNESVLLFAVWKKIEVKCFVNHYLQKDDGSFEDVPNITDEINVEKDTELIVADMNKLDENGFVFAYAEYDNTKVNNIILDEDKLLKFYYTRQYTVSYELDGGSNGPEKQYKGIGEEITLSDVIPTKDGFNFFGWTNVKDSVDLVYSPNDKFNNDSDMELYAIWGENTISPINIAAEGTYVKYVLMNTSYSLESDDTGANNSQEFKPNNAISWKVFSNQGNEVELVSDKNIGELTFQGKIGYSKAVGTLKNLCNQYVNNLYALSGRCLGSSDDSVEEVDVDELNFELDFDNTPENVYSDNYFNKDMEKLKEQSLVYDEVFFASRNVEDDDVAKRFGIRYILNNTVEDEFIYEVSESSDSESAVTKGVRAVITLKPDVCIVGGTGIETDPYVLATRDCLIDSQIDYSVECYLKNDDNTTYPSSPYNTYMLKGYKDSTFNVEDIETLGDAQYTFEYIEVDGAPVMGGILKDQLTIKAFYKKN